MRLDLDGFTEQEVFQYVLEGLERARDRVAQAIADLREQIGQPNPRKHAPKAAPAPAKRAAAPKAPKAAKSKPAPGNRLSEEARKRIAAAQHKRWAKVRRENKAAAKQAAQVEVTAPEPEPELATAE